MEQKTTKNAEFDRKSLRIGLNLFHVEHFELEFEIYTGSFEARNAFLFHVEQTKPRNPDFSDKNIRVERVFSIFMCGTQEISARVPFPLSEAAVVDSAFHSV